MLGASSGEHAKGLQRLVEAEVVAPTPLAGRFGGDELQQLKAVADGDIAHPTALGRHDHGDPAQHLHPGHRLGLVAGPLGARVDQGAKLGEGARVPDPAHVGGQVADRGGDGEPGKRWAEHVAADQGPQRAAQVSAWKVDQVCGVGGWVTIIGRITCYLAPACQRPRQRHGLDSSGWSTDLRYSGKP